MSSEISNKASDCMRTASIDEAADLLRKIAGGRHADESLKAVFRRLKRKLSDWSDNRIRDIWRRDSRVRLRSEEIDQLRAIVNQRAGQENTKDDLAELRSTVARLAKYEALLERIDTGLFGPEISAPRDQLGEASRLLGNRGARLRP
jgi:hypothetical protein